MASRWSNRMMVFPTVEHSAWRPTGSIDPVPVPDPDPDHCS
jgi:hypothetical protein